jgi:hypothetical protein
MSTATSPLRVAGQRLGGLKRVGTPEQIKEAEHVVATLWLERYIADTIAAGVPAATRNKAAQRLLKQTTVPEPAPVPGKAKSHIHAAGLHLAGVRVGLAPPEKIEQAEHALAMAYLDQYIDQAIRVELPKAARTELAKWLIGGVR